MTITFDEKTGIFCLHTERTTYQMKIGRYGHLLHLYYGARTDAPMDGGIVLRDRGFSNNPYEAGQDRTYSLDALPQEFPTRGTGDYRSPLLTVTDARGICGSDLRYAGYRIREGKYELPGLPAVCAKAGQSQPPDGMSEHAKEPDGPQTLEILLRCDDPRMEVRLLYGVLPHLDIITRSAVIRNTAPPSEGSGRSLTLEKAQTACLDFTEAAVIGADGPAGRTAADPGAQTDSASRRGEEFCREEVRRGEGFDIGEEPDKGFDRIILRGRHAMERIPDRRPVGHGSYVIGSRRGFSSHQYNPFLILCERDADEENGRCWSMQFVYSGGFKAEVELDQYGQVRMQMGLLEEQFAWPLAPGEELTLPEVIMSFSGEGLGRLSRNHHACIREHLIRWPKRYEKGMPPVLLNSWEACYFDFDGEKICRMAEEAKALGMDMIVMDDGWFGRRNDDLRSLGDWIPNEEKLGCSLGELSRRIHDMGMQFGIWMEPEMVSEDSDLYREHPDWALRIPGRDPVRSRYQLVLDLSRPDVVDGIYARICRVLDSAGIEYLKWDANRHIADLYSAERARPGGKGDACSPGAARVKSAGMILHGYILGLYDLLERIRRRYPGLLIESCSGGGGRFDAGMLYYTPQIWCSDNTDPVDRLAIQYGTSFGYPVCTMGSHVSASPNELTGRHTSLSLRAAVAMSGTFGYELDPLKLTAEEKEEIRRQIRRFKEYAPLIRNGSYYRLSDPATGRGAWMIVSEDQQRAVLTTVVTGK